MPWFPGFLRIESCGKGLFSCGTHHGWVFTDGPTLFFHSPGHWGISEANRQGGLPSSDPFPRSFLGIALWILGGSPDTSELPSGTKARVTHKQATLHSLGTRSQVSGADLLLLAPATGECPVDLSSHSESWKETVKTAGLILSCTFLSINDSWTLTF